MNNRPVAPSPARSIIETLEARTFLCGTAAAVVHPAGVSEQSAVEVAAKPIRKAPTKTTLAASVATLAAPVTFTATVRASAAAGSPEGTVNIVDHGHVIETITLAPTTSTNPKYAFSDGSITLTQQPGGAPYYFGRHAFTARFIPTGAFNKSSGPGSMVVPKPTYTALPDGVEYDSVIAGSGAPAQSGQSADVLYTGYLAKNGKIFDSSVRDGGTPFPFTLGGGNTITGFDDGTEGMQVGETRVVLIPPAEGYGSRANGPIPANSTLIFVITMESIT